MAFDNWFMQSKEASPVIGGRFSPSAERMRRHRERRRDGMRCLIIELHDTEISALVREGLLNPETRHNRNAIADALYGHLERTLVP